MEPILTRRPPADPALSYIIDQILPKQCVHLIGGSSGAGKTRLIFPLLDKWSRGEDVWGHRSYPVPWAYIAGDRSRKSVSVTLDQLGLDPDLIRGIWAVDIGNLNLMSLLKAALLLEPHPEFIFVEGIASLMPDILDMNKYKHVAQFLVQLSKFCTQHNLTILGSTHATKVKTDAKFDNPRERMMGSAAWAAFSETIFVLETLKPDEENSQRKLYILPRNAPDEHRFYQIKQGKLVEVGEQDARSVAELFLATIKVGESFSTDQYLAFTMTTVSRTSAFRVLKDLEAECAVSRVGRGILQRCRIT